MASRTYAQIECSLTGSKRIRLLSNGSVRWAYMCAHLSTFCTYTGLFKYPPEIWAHDAQMTGEQLEAAISEMSEVGLIEHDPQEDYVRVVGWFHKRSGPDNPNRVDSVISDLSTMDDMDPHMFCNAASELVTASVKRSLRWKSDAPGRNQLYESLKRFLREVYQDYGDVFLTALNSELDDGPATIRTEITALLPVLAMKQGQPLGNPLGTLPPTLAEHETRRDVDETKTKLKLDDTKTAHFPSFESQLPEPHLVTSDLLRRGQPASSAALNSPMSVAARNTA